MCKLCTIGRRDGSLEPGLSIVDRGRCWSQAWLRIRTITIHSGWDAQTRQICMYTTQCTTVLSVARQLHVATARTSEGDMRRYLEIK